ncbi:MAG: protease modulator HflC [Pseudomonadota bacterium]
MNRISTVGLLIAFLIAVVLLLSSTFTVSQWQQALVLQFGEPRRVVEQPGLHFKLPFVQNVIYFDKRVLNLDLAPAEMPTNDQKQVVVDVYAKYRIVNPLKFYQVVRDETGLRGRVGPIISANLRAEIGKVPMAEMLTERRADFMRSITEAVNRASLSYGVNVMDVRMKRVDLPEENSQAIFRRMQTQREQEARRFRAEGQRDAEALRAEADKQKVVILSDARRQAEIRRGEGEAEATRIYNDAYGKDPAFFDFYRSMQALSQGLNGENTTYVGPPAGDFFRFFGSESGSAAAPAAPKP